MHLWLVIRVSQHTSDARWCIGADLVLFVVEGVRSMGLSHGNIVRMIGQSLATPPYCIILEHMPAGDLKSYLRMSVCASPPLTFPHLLALTVDVNAGYGLRKYRLLLCSLAPVEHLID